MELRCSVRFPKEGIWEIKGLVEGKDWPEPDFWQIDDIELAVTQEAGGIKEHTTYGPELSYLDYFSYGRVGEYVLDEEHPLVLTLDVPRSPRAGEEIPVTCTIRSLEDKPDFSVEFGFRRGGWPQRTIPVPPEIVLVSGDLRWQGDIKTGDTVQFSINVRFPEAGDWAVNVRAPASDDWKYSNSIMFHISEEWGAFGWSFSDKNCPDYMTPRPSPLQSPLTRPE